MSTKVFTYILDFQGNTQKFGKQVGGVKGLLKGAAVAAGAMFAADKIMDAAAAVADYAKEISGVRTEISKLTGAQGAALSTMTGQIQAVADVYDQDVNETMKASNAIMKAFGVDSKQTFDIINAGFATTANSNDDFLKQVSEYSIHFKEAGLEAAQMVAVIAEGNKMGVYDDKAADAIKEGSIRLREMTQGTKDALDAIGLSSTTIQSEISSGNKSMFEVMQLVSRQLNTLPQQAPAVGQALADIFGGPGEDAIQFIRSLGDMNISLEEVIRASGGAAAAQMMLTAETAKFHEIGAQVFGGTGKMITQIKGVMMGWVNDSIRGLVGLANYFIDLYNESMIFRAGIEYIKFTVKTSFDFIGLVFKQFWNQLKGVGSLIKAVVTGNIKEIPGILKETFQSSIDNAKGFGEGVANRFKDGVENVLNPREKIALITIDEGAVFDAGAAAAKKFADGFKSGVDGIGQLLNTKSVSTVETKKATTIEAPKLMVGGLSDMGGFLDQNTEKAKRFREEMEKLKPDRIQDMAADFHSLGDSIGGTAGSFFHLAGTMAQLIPQLIAQIVAMGAAQVATSAATTAAKGSEAIASGVAASQSVPFPFNLIALAATTGAIISALASVPSFATGGVIPGSSFIGDRTLIRANSGEEVLRRDDPRHTFNQRASTGSVSAGRDRLIIPTTKIRKGDIYIAYHEAERELGKRT